MTYVAMEMEAFEKRQQLEMAVLNKHNENNVCND